MKTGCGYSMVQAWDSIHYACGIKKLINNYRKEKMKMWVKSYSIIRTFYVSEERHLNKDIIKHQRVQGLLETHFQILDA